MIRPTRAHRLAAEVARAARRAAAARVLILDIDGTLAPIAPSPADARVPDGVIASLRRLAAAGWRIAVVSGRSAARARAMIPVARVAVYGSHGIESAGRGLPPRVRSAAARLRPLARDARPLTRGFPGVEVERKPAGIAFHDRALSRAARAAWRRRLGAWLGARDLSGLEILRGKGVIEVRPAGFGKGRVARRWPKLSGTGRDGSFVVIGDDRTDEDLFAAARTRAVTVRVGPPGVRSAARRRLPSAIAVASFLAELAQRSIPDGGR